MPSTLNTHRHYRKKTTMPKNKHTKAFNVKMTPDQYAMLQQLATDSGIKMADVLRGAISNRFQQRYSNVPKCATGNACLCPNMHMLQNSPTNTDKELLDKVQAGEIV